jgi:hypothetical protein
MVLFPAKRRGDLGAMTPSSWDTPAHPATASKVPQLREFGAARMQLQQFSNRARGDERVDSLSSLLQR